MWVLVFLIGLLLGVADSLATRRRATRTTPSRSRGSAQRAWSWRRTVRG
jgi:hypothetical protein